MIGTRRPGSAVTRSPAIATFLSFLWPGLGQWYEGRPRSALLYAVPVALAVLAIGLQALGGIEILVAQLFTPTFALTVLILIVLVGLWRLLSMADALVNSGQGSLGGGRGAWRRRPALPLFAVLAVIAIVVHGVAGYYAWSFYDAGSHIFVGSNPDGSMDPNAVAGGPSPSGTPGSPTPGVDFSSTPYATPASASSRITILLSGIDNGLGGRTESLTDTMLVVTVEPTTKRVVMLSFPRDISEFPLYSGGIYQGKLNSLMTWATLHPKDFPEGGLTTLEKELGYLLGVPINYYAAINLAGFEDMVAAVGGVTVVNPRAIDDPSYAWLDGSHGFSLPAGTVRLDGSHALAFVRSRKGVGDSDFTRANRQQLLLVALRKKVTSPSMLPAIPRLLQAAGNTIRTNFPSDRVGDMLTLAKGVNDKSIARYVLGPPYSVHPPTNTTGGTYILRLDMAKLSALSIKLFGSDSRYATTGGQGTGSVSAP